MLRAASTTFVFEGVGTRGDVSPLIALGGALIARGHQCHLLACDDFGPEAIAAGMSFHPTVARVEAGADRELPTGARLERCFFPALDQTAQVVRGLRARSRRAPVIVNCDRFVATSLLGERDGLSLVRLHLCPFKIRSRVAPPWPFRRQAEGLLGRTYLKYRLPRLLQAFDGDDRVLAIVNRRRSSLDLAPVASAAEPEPWVRRQVALFPAWYARPAADWPADIALLGFALPAPNRPAPRALEDFIARQGPPLVFTPGTGVSQVAGFFRAAEACCRQLGRAGVFLSPHLAGWRGAGFSTDRIATFDYVDLATFLDRAALLVHHGGIGTTARALQAGIPQIVSPLGFDQPDNGDRVRLLGVGQVLERAQLTGAALAAAASALLHNPAARLRLQRVRDAVAGDDAIARCADLLEQVAAGETGDPGEFPSVAVTEASLAGARCSA